ncbi:hypothetical protein [Hydrogenophaga sp.]|uniref:hypothetical protein n=1 Tax=Hydrogenophaga sp. TaxID=1904254 RepID=UPI003D1224AD
MSMKESDLVADLKASLHDSAAVFRAPLDADFRRFLAQALPDMQFKRPITRLGTVTLTVDEGRYAMPVDDFAALKTSLWGGTTRLRPWEPGYPGAVPRAHATWDGTAWWIELEIAPTAAQLAAWTNALSFWYFARHVVSDEEGATTVNALDRGLLLLRAQAEAMLELSVRNASKPVQLRDGLSGTPRNSTPAALYQALLDEFREAR